MPYVVQSYRPDNSEILGTSEFNCIVRLKTLRGVIKRLKNIVGNQSKNGHIEIFWIAEEFIYKENCHKDCGSFRIDENGKIVIALVVPNIK